MNLDIVKGLHEIGRNTNEDFLRFIEKNKEACKDVFPSYFIMLSQMAGDLYAALLKEASEETSEETVSPEHLENMYLACLSAFIKAYPIKVKNLGDIIIRKDKTAASYTKKVLDNLKKYDPKNADEFDEMISDLNKDAEGMK